jgi:multidrug resistance efflux pump
MAKMRSVVGVLLLLVIVATGILYIQTSVRKSSAPPRQGRAPSLEAAPVRLYGIVEPVGREVFVGPQQARRVERVFVREGQDVTAGQPLCELEQDVERQALQVARSRRAELEKRLELVLDELSRERAVSWDGMAERRALEGAVLRTRELEGRLALVLDELKRREPLSQSGAISEVEYTQKSLEADLVRRQIATARSQALLEYSQKSLEAELLRRQIDTAEAEIQLKERELGMLTLRAPIRGYLYKFDVRVGEYLTPQDYRRIVIGETGKQVRLFVESFWLDKIQKGDRFEVRDAETLRRLGAGKVVSISEYVGARDFRTEDSLERLDTKYAQAILEMDGASATPLGKLVLCVRETAAADGASSGSS